MDVIVLLKITQAFGLHCHTRLQLKTNIEHITWFNYTNRSLSSWLSNSGLSLNCVNVKGCLALAIGVVARRCSSIA